MTEKLDILHVTAKFVSRVLTEDQKVNRLNIPKLLDRISGNKNFLKTIVTKDRTWVYGYGVKTKAKMSQWVKHRSSRLKKARVEFITNSFHLAGHLDERDLGVASWQCTCSLVVPLMQFSG
ncbi:hypothetical protein Trydic_g22391 [Trypoxylus dichotomus]